MPALPKTNACRLLDTLGIAYELLAYEVDEAALDAVTVAHKLGLPPEQVLKTLVLTGDAGVPHFVAVIPGPEEIDLKKAARAAGAKRATMLPLRELTPLTGYVRGGCSALGMKRALPTYLEESAQLFDRICVSPGQRGLQIMIAPQDLARAAHAHFADLI